MRRVTVRIDDDAPGWAVSVRTDDTDVVAPYRMSSATIGGRRMPTTPPDRSPAADEPHADLCAGDTEAVSALLKRIATRQTNCDDVRRYGRWLFECLLAPAWPAILARADHAVEIALRIPIHAVDLHRLIWEAMGDDCAPLAAHPAGVIALTRLVPAPPTRVRTITGVPRVLFATSVPLSDPTIRPGAMFMGLLRGFDASGRCRARAVQGVSDDDLATACAEFRPDIVHLVAHGVLLDDGRGALMLRGDGGERETDATALVGALTTGTTRPLAVLLSACNTASAGEGEDPADAAPLAAQLVAAGIPVVSAMAGEVSESACRLYTRRLAEAVHDGQPITAASAHGRRATLVDSDAPSASIDWALPALFLAEDLDPALPLVDATRARYLARLANDLGLRKEPVFIGRDDVLDAADSMLLPGAETGTVAVLSPTSTSRLGGTRLLREIGWRLLRDGHVPVLLGPYPQKSDLPTSARGLVYEVLRQIVSLTEKLGLPPFPPKSLRESMSKVDFDALCAEVADDPDHAAMAIRRALKQFQKQGELDVDGVREPLRKDLVTLAERAAALGQPFGEHTKAVLLCDDVHTWASPGGQASGLDCLLRMVTASGLGLPNASVPVVFTGSTISDGGQALSAWSANIQPGILVHDLGELTPEDALVGYQWVLLHPWATKPAAERARFGHVYTASPARTTEWEDSLREVGGLPTSVDRDLYLAAAIAARVKVCSRDDDEKSWHDYTTKYRP
jgi:hypothetical protein